MNFRLFSAVLFFILLACLLGLTYYPDMPEMKLHIRNEWIRLDYIGHLGFYAAVAASFLSWRTGWRGIIPLKLMIFTISGGIAFGIITEITQKLSPGRSFNLLDILYNCIGIITGTAVIYLMSKTKNTSPIVPPPFPKGGGQGVGS